MARKSKLKKMLHNKLTPFIFIALFAIAGVYLLVGGHAATPYVSTSAGNGTVGCNASIQTTGGNNYVKFGSGTSCQGGGTGPGSMWVSLVDGGEVQEA